MNAHNNLGLKKAARLEGGLVLRAVLLGIIISWLYVFPVSAAPEKIGRAGETQKNRLQNACTPPGDWDGTKRLYYKSTVSRDWAFEVEEPEMDVVLEFFYYQDYDPEGCPFDCSTGKCQTVEIGEGETPFGGFAIGDGQEGANGGVVRLEGRLAEGAYDANFGVTGEGSINIGLRVHKSSVPVEPPPTPTPTEVTVPPTEEPTPTATEISSSPTPGGIVTVSPATEMPPTPTATLAPTTEVLPPAPTATGFLPTPTEEERRRPMVETDEPETPPTLPPPSRPRRSSQPPVLVPVTGASQAAGGARIPELGAGLLGLALVYWGLKIRHKP